MIKVRHVGIILSILGTIIAFIIMIEGILFVEQHKDELRDYKETTDWTDLLSNSALSSGVSMLIIFPCLAGALLLKNRDLVVTAITFGSMGSVILVVCGSLLIAYKEKELWCAQLIPELTFQSEAATKKIADVICNSIPDKALSAGILSFIEFGLLMGVLGLSCAAERELMPKSKTTTTTTIINNPAPQQVAPQPTIVYVTAPQPGQGQPMMMGANGQPMMIQQGPPMIMGANGQPMMLQPGTPIYTTDANGNLVQVG